MSGRRPDSHALILCEKVMDVKQEPAAKQTYIPLKGNRSCKASLADEGAGLIRRRRPLFERAALAAAETTSLAGAREQ